MIEQQKPRKTFDLCEAGMPVSDHAHHVLRYRLEKHVERFIARKTSDGLYFFKRDGLKEGVFEEPSSNKPDRKTAYMMSQIKFTYLPRPTA